MALKIYNQTPYYDDFNEDKNFHRLLFQPGRAVQARELTQSQTILQDQIQKFGNHLFKDGSRVSGAEIFSIGEGKLSDANTSSVTNASKFQLQSSIHHINLNSTIINADGANVAINVSNVIGNYVAVNATGVASNTGDIKNIFYVHHADAIDTDAGDPDTLYVSHIKLTNVANSGFVGTSYLSTASNGSLGNVTVSGNDTLQVFSSVDLNTSNLVTTVNTGPNQVYGPAKVLGVTDGVYYINGVFVKNQQQLISVDKYDKKSNVSIGFSVAETVVSSTDDTSLLDPALDSSNYLAPGADRYKVSLSLIKRQLSSNVANVDSAIPPTAVSSKYIELARFKNGVLVKDESKTKYSELGRTLARRTYDESGNYTLKGLTPKISNLGNSANALLTVTKGKAYVKGYEIEKISDINLPLPKARDTITLEDNNLQADYGNYIFVHQSNNHPFRVESSERVLLYSSNTVLDTTTEIGEGYVRSIRHQLQANADEDAANGYTEVHRLHLFGVKAIGNTPLSLTKTIQGTAESGTANANCNVYSTSVITKLTSGYIMNSTNNIIVTDPTNIQVGDEVFGFNISNSSTSTERRIYVVAKEGSNLELSNTMVSGPTGLGTGFVDSPGTDGNERPIEFRRAVFSDTRDDRAVFTGTYGYADSLSNMAYQSRRSFRAVAVTSGVASIDVTDILGQQFITSGTAALKRTNFQIAIRTKTAGGYIVGEMVDMANTGVTTTVSANGLFTTIDLGDTGYNGTIDVLATIETSNVARRAITSITPFIHDIDQLDYNDVTGTVNVHSLGVTHLKNVTHIFISNDPASNAGSNTAEGAVDANTNVVQEFIVDTGQRDGFFDHATIKLRSNTTIVPAGSPLGTVGTVNTGKVTVLGNYYRQVGEGPLTVDSYKALEADYGLEYYEFPTFRNRNGDTISLRDAIDFRPVRDLAINVANVYTNTNMSFSEVYMPDSSDPDITANTIVYMPRIDKLVLGFDGEARIIEGRSALNDPPVPADDPDSMTLAKLSLDPYTITGSNVKLDLVQNRRYTMKDIGRIDDRLTKVEYYTSLNLLESEIATSSFLDDNGLELLSNGFLVDPFIGHSLGDVTNPDYKCSVDYDNRELLPRFVTNVASLAAASDSESGATNSLTDTGGVLTLNFTEDVYASVAAATDTINVNPFNVIGFVGHVVLETDVATYADFDSRPVTAVNSDGNSDNYQYGENYQGSKWNEWDLFSFEKDSAKVYTYYDTKGQKVRTTSSAQEAASYNTQTESDKVYYYASAQNINFQIYGYKPNTIVRAFVDGINVSHLLRRFENGAYTTNSLLLSDKNGYVKGRLSLPNDADAGLQFIAGKHQIIFADSLFNPTFHSTIAAVTYFSGEPTPEPVEPIIEEEPVQPIPVNPDPITYDCFFYWDQVWQTPNCIDKAGYDRYLTTTPHGDPAVTISQSTINSWSNKIVSYYGSLLKRKPDKAGYGWWLASLEAGNYPNDATNPNHQEIIQANMRASNEYQELQQGIAVDPVAETFFVNELSNPQGIFVPSVDLFFATKDDEIPVFLEIRDTVNGYPGSHVFAGAVVVKNPDEVNVPTTTNELVATTFTFEKPVFLEPGEYCLVIKANSDKYSVFIATVGQNRIDTLGAGQSITGQPYSGSFFKSQNASTWEPDQLSDLCFTIKKCNFSTDPGTFKLQSQKGSLPDDVFYDYLKVTAPYETFSDKTSLAFSIDTRKKGESSKDGAINILPGTGAYMVNRKEFDVTDDSNLTVSMTSTNPDVSPTFDYKRGRTIFVQNIINNSDNTAVTTTPETEPNGGGALAKYITKRISLADEFNATSLRVIVSKNLPKDTSIAVYYKVQSVLDGSNFDGLPYVEMTRTTPLKVSETRSTFYDCEYRADNITYTSDENNSFYDSFKYFTIKIVLYAKDESASSPTIKNLRVIALS